METKHTKGEWRQAHRICDEEGNYSTQVFDEDGETICTLAWHKVPMENGFTTDREANAKLIAAAPDLLEVVLELDRITGYAYDDPVIDESLYNKMLAAIKKATE